jgi:peptidoglycan-associated lipoprotein
VTTSKILTAAALVACIAVAGCASRPKPPVASGPDMGAAAPSSRPPAAEPGYGEPAVPESLAKAFAEQAGDRVFFAFDSYDLDAEARAVLERQAAWLRAHPQVRALINGNADERGTREYNLALGARRAEAARAYLAVRGVAAGRLETMSYGKERPIDPRSSEEGWARNRNAQTVLIGLSQR